MSAYYNKMVYKVDNNSKEILDAAKKLGCTILRLEKIGKGCSDDLLGYKGFNILIEIKDGKKCPSQRKLNPIQVKFHSEWKGQKPYIIYSVDDLIDLLRIFDSWHQSGWGATRVAPHMQYPNRN